MSGLPPLQSLTLEQIAHGLDDGTFTVTELVQAHLDRIEALNPVLHAVLQVNPAALSIAGALEEELGRSGRRGLLHGVPILIKDNVVTAENLEATAGSLALIGAKPARESPVVTKLRDAGAVIIGTANLSEWANFRSRPSDSGWSARGGQTFGTYHEHHDPGGSSSGSGVGVDMGFCVLAVGTETSGSIISPASENNVVGIKPTTGLVSRDSVIPISQDQDTVGCIGRTVEDAATMLSVIAGRDEHDTKTNIIPFDAVPDYRQACTQTQLPRLRLGVPRNATAKIELTSILEAFEDVLQKLRTALVEIVDFDLPGLAKFDELSPEEITDAMAGDFNVAIADYLGKLTSNPNNLHVIGDLVDYIKVTEGEEYPERNIERFEQTAKRTSDSPEYRAAKERSAYFAGEGGIKGAMDKHKLDAIVCPSKAPGTNYFAACGGFPQIAVPLGYLPEDTEAKHNDTGNLVKQGPNMPYGISVIGDSFSETKLLMIANIVETMTRTRDKAESFRLPHLR